MKKTAYALISLLLFANLFMGCSSTGGAQTSQTPQTSTASQTKQKTEDESDKLMRILKEDDQKLVVGSDGKPTIESIETTFHLKTIASINEITNTVLSEPGRPYYFKIRAIYKGYDKEADKVYLQDIGENQANVKNAVSGVIFGINTDVFAIDIVDVTVPTLPTKENSIADYYIIAFRSTEYNPPDDIGILIRFVRNIEESGFDPAKFILAYDARYITVNVYQQKNELQQMGEAVLLSMLGGRSMPQRPVGNIYYVDPITYPLVDLMDARVAMNKKDLFNDYTFPTVRVKYVSEVVFKGQTNTTIRVSTSDNVLTERMDFTGRASTIQNGEKIRVYYTIAKDPLEIWEVHAIERF